MINYKIIIGFAAFAFVVSILAGLIGGVAFGALLLRTLAATIVFAGLGLSVGWVIEKYLPGLLRPDGNPKTAGVEEEKAGDGVNIVLPEENPHEETGEAEEDDGELIDEVESVDADLPTGEDEEEDFSDIDSMPTLDTLEGDFTSQEESQDLDSRETTRNVEVMGTSHDPAEAARAIKTWLKRDDKKG
jgi:hypothetical protein